MPLTQSEAQVQTEIARRIAVFQEASKFAGISSSGSLLNYLEREKTAFQDATPGDYTRLSDAALRAQVRNRINDLLSASAARAVLEPLFLNYAKVVGNITGQDITSVWPWIYQRFVNNSLSIKSRNISFATPAAGSNLGDGVINRLTVDENGFDMEACHVESKRAFCSQDSTKGGTSRHEEEFTFEGATANIDRLVVSGSGASKTIKAKSARDSLLANPTFDSLDGTAITSLTSVPQWTLGGGAVIADFQLDRTNYYRDFQGATDPASLKWSNNGVIQQAFSVNNIISRGRPIYGQLAFNRSIGSADGTLWFAIGNHSVSVVLSAQSGWNILKLVLNRNSWPQNMLNVSSNANTLVKIQYANRSSGSLLLDDVLLFEMDDFDGHYYAPVGGATPFVAGPNAVRDKFTWSDTFVGVVDSIIAKWLWLTFNLYLPGNKVGAQTWAEPTV